MKEKHQEYIKAIESQLQREQAEAYAKLDDGLIKLQQQFSNKTFFYLFAICPRWFSKHARTDSGEENAEPLQDLDTFKVTHNWSYSQFARLYILLKASNFVAAEDYEKALHQLFDTADVNELILLVQALAFIPGSERFIQRAREAARSNMASVFSAVAHQSDFAFRNFDEGGWNQLILKAAFLAVPIWSIYGLRERNNVELALMLKNYVTERQAANRVLPWDIWACIAWLAISESELAYLRAQFANLDAQSQGAILLALQENTTNAAQDLAKELRSKELCSKELCSKELRSKELRSILLSWQDLAGLATK